MTLIPYNEDIDYRKPIVMSQVNRLRLKPTNRRYGQLKKAVQETPVPSDATLRQSEAFYRQMFERNHSVEMVIDLADGRIAEANQAACNFYGYTLEKFKTLHVTDINILPESELQVIIERVTAEKGLTFHTQHRLASGAIRDVQVFAGLLEVNSQRYLYSIIHDITEHQQAERALHKRENLYRLVTQHMPNSSIFMFDHDLRYTFVEGPYIKNFGSSYGNMIGKTLQNVLPAESVAFLEPIYRRALGGESFSFERIAETFSYESYAAPVLDETGKIIGGVILSHDITERKKTEKALREHEELLRLFTQHMLNSSILMFDQEKRFTLVEGDFLRRIGFIPENMIGKLPYEVFSEETLHFMLPIYERVLKGESFAYERTTPDFAYTAYANPLKNAAGEIIGGMFLSHDITEAKRAEEALRISEARFHSLVDLAPVGIIQTDVQGKRIFCNARWCEMTGITLEQALGDENYETIYPDDLPIAAGAWTTMMETNLPFDNTIFRYQRPDKTTIWVSGNGRPFYDPQGEIAGYIGSVTDITEHKLLEELLTASEARFRTLIEFAPVGIVETDSNGIVILGNERWSILTGIPQDRAVIGDGTENVHADDLQMVLAANQQMLESLTPIDNLEYRFQHSDGKVVWVSDSSCPIFDLDGNITGSICTMTDITERKRLEDALRQNEERLRNITDNLEDLVSQSDGEGNFVFVSRSYQTALGYNPESLISKSSIDLLHPEDIPILTQAMLKAVESGVQQVNFQSRLRHADGHYIHVESVGKLFPANEGIFTGGVFISRDISERLRVQNLLLEKEKLQTALDKELELNNLKTRMMNRIAHEFRTPLTVIQATTETLTYYLDRLSADQRKAKEASIKGQIRRLTDMLDEIGQVIKTNFTPDHVHRVATDLSVLCRQIVTQIEQEMNQPGQFELDLPEKTEVLVDPQVLRNALLQVMHNAARFSEPSAPVKVKLSAENGVTLRVTDTGIGIPTKEQPRIFEPFFRGSNIGESSGLGVGLTMTRAAIDAHGGTITVESELGKGTTVTIWIPVEKAC